MKTTRAVEQYRAWGSRRFWRYAWAAFCLPVLVMGGPAGTLDPGFDVKSGFGLGAIANGGYEIRALVAQGDGKLVVAGEFDHFQGLECASVVRLNRDGSLDPSFLPHIEGESVESLLPLAGGGFIISGQFTRINNSPRPGLAQLQADGSVDTNFMPDQDFYGVQAVARQSDGKLLVCQTNQLVRLLTNGSSDPEFTAVPITTWRVVLTVLPDDRFLINGIDRRHPNGTIDTTFKPAFTNQLDIKAVLPLADGRLLVSGLFTVHSEQGLRPYTSLVCLNSDGSQAADFKPDIVVQISPYCEGEILCMTQQPDGKILVGGRFMEVNGNRHPALARLRLDGTVDEDFRPEIAVRGWCEDDQFINRMVLDSDRLYIGGFITEINGLVREDLARLFISPEGTPAVIRWERGLATGVESQGQLALEVIREGNLENMVSVRYAPLSWWGESAIVNQDYTLTAERVVFAPGETNRTISISLLTDSRVEPGEQFALNLEDPSGYAVLGYPQSAIITIHDADSAGKPGSLDTTFKTDLGQVDCYPGILGIAPCADGATIVHGIFQRADVTQFRLFARLLPEGKADPTFLTQLDGDVLDCVVEAAGKAVYIGGNFTNVNGALQPSVARLNQNGALDTNFRVQIDGLVGRLAMSPNGQLIIFGNFTRVNGQPRARLARLDADGKLDASFTAAMAPRWTDYWNQGGELPCLVPQPDGKLLVGGCGPNEAYGIKENLFRLLPDGTRDGSFKVEDYADMIYVQAVALQPDGRILVGGYCRDTVAMPRAVIRLLPDGTLDSSFQSGFYGSAHSLVLQPDGKILVAGVVNSGLNPRHRSVARLNLDGTLDLSFLVGNLDDYSVNTMAIQADGKVLLGGRFVSVNNVACPYLARLHGDALIQANRLPGSLTLAGPYYRTTQGMTAVEVAVQRIWGNQGAVEVDYFTEDISAAAGIDYQAQSGRLRFADGDVNPQTIRIPLLNGTVPPKWGTFVLHLTNATPGATIGPFATTTIEISGEAPVVRFYIMQTTVQENDGSVRVAISCDGPRANAITAEYRTLDSTALAGEDYQARTGAVNFDANSGYTQVIEIPISNDSRPENDENFMVQLVKVNGPGSLGSSTNLEIIIRDDDHYYNPGNVDTHFRPGSGTPGEVRTLGLQSDGKILVGGEFYQFSGFTRWALAQLLPNGQVDSAFAPFIKNESSTSVIVDSLQVQPDGRIVLAGRFDHVNGQARKTLARLNASGWLDATFDAGEGLQGGEQNTVTAMALQSDGKLLLSGDFQKINGVNRCQLARLLSNGQVDSSFDPGSSIGSERTPQIFALAVQGDQKILLGGGFSTFHGSGQSYLARVQAQGALDESFHPQLNQPVRALAVQPDQHILVGGAFTQVNGKTANHLARLNPDGSLDESFNAGSGLGQVGGVVYELVVHNDGHIFLGGLFNEYNGQPRRAIARLEPDGSLDTLFDTGAILGGDQPVVHAIALQENNQVIIGGQFGLVGGLHYGNIARLNGGGAAAFLPGLCRLESGGGLRLGLSVIPGLPFVLQASTNLWEWHTLNTNTAPSERFEWVDADALQHPQRYYRALTIRGN